VVNMTRVQKVQETYDPNGAVVRSEQKSKARGAQSAGGGAPGTASNLPGQPAVASGGAASGDESQSSTTNFEINKTVATITEPVGGLRRQSIAVVVDNSPPRRGAEDGAAPATVAPRSDEEMRKITDLVRAAAGIDEERGDILIVQNIPFEEMAPETGAGGGDGRWLLWLQVARYAMLPLAVLLVWFLAIRPGIAALRAPRAAVPASPAGPPTIAQMQAQLAQVGAGDDAGAGLRRRLIEAARQEPQAAAVVLRGWLDEGGRG
jgi:flagellar M-ring protein FliF